MTDNSLGCALTSDPLAIIFSGVSQGEEVRGEAISRTFLADTLMRTRPLPGVTVAATSPVECGVTEVSVTMSVCGVDMVGSCL